MGLPKGTKEIDVTMDSWTYGEVVAEPQYNKKYSVLRDYLGFFFNRTETYYQGETKLSGKPTDVGKYKVIVSYEDDVCIYTGEAEFEIYIATTTLTFDLPTSDSQYVLYLPYGDTCLLLPEDSERFKGLSFAGYDADIIDVDANGNITGKQLGETSVTVKVQDTNYSVEDVTVLVIVTPVVTLDPNGGSVETTTVNTKDGKMTALPRPTHTDYTFDGWFTEKEGGEPVDENTVFEDNTTIYAHWTVATYTITFHVTGTTNTYTLTTNAEGKLTFLPPTPTRTGYTFAGWYTAEVGGEEITLDTVFTGETTIYAHWTKVEKPARSVIIPTYSVIKANAEEGGSISPSGRAAVVWGGNKTFTITPNDGYAIADVKIDGQSVGTVASYTFAQVRGDHTITATFTKIEETPTTDEPVEDTPIVDEQPILPFTDVTETDAFYDAVRFVYEQGYMNGISTDTFAPNDSLTRGMLVTVLYRAAGSPVIEGDNPFTDVADDAWYYDAVVWAKSIGLVKGISETEFTPESQLTREQLVTIFHRYATFLSYDVSVGEDTNILSYEDFTNISEYAIPAMQWACGMRYIEDMDGSLLPQDDATRALVATLLQRFCDGILE